MKQIMESYNAAVGVVMTVLIEIIGAYNYIFSIYMVLNILDWLTGWYKARKNQELSSQKGFSGALKKIGYWVIILIAFLIPYVFVTLGEEMLGLDLSFLSTLGWFTLASLIINEIRSILENLIACGYKVPEILTRGLSITKNIVEEKETPSQ